MRMDLYTETIAGLFDQARLYAVAMSTTETIPLSKE